MVKIKNAEFKNPGNYIVFKSIFFKYEFLFKCLMNSTFESLNLDYHIHEFNIHNWELVVNNVFLKSIIMDELIGNDNFKAKILDRECYFNLSKWLVYTYSKVDNTCLNSEVRYEHYEDSNVTSEFIKQL